MTNSGQPTSSLRARGDLPVGAWIASLFVLAICAIGLFHSLSADDYGDDLRVMEREAIVLSLPPSQAQALRDADSAAEADCHRLEWRWLIATIVSAAIFLLLLMYWHAHMSERRWAFGSRHGA